MGERGSMSSRLPAVALVAATGACSSGSPAPGAAIEVDRATCETGLTTLATFDATAQPRSLAVGADGTVFVIKWDATVLGLYTIGPSGGAPVRIADAPEGHGGIEGAGMHGDTRRRGDARARHGADGHARLRLDHRRRPTAAVHGRSRDALSGALQAADFSRP